MLIKPETEDVSTHSRPKAAAALPYNKLTVHTSFNTQPPEGGCHSEVFITPKALAVSTHSRPKAAANDHNV